MGGLKPANTRTRTRTSCMYCDAELTEATRFSHPFPNGLGGRLRSRSICCTPCNEAIGRLEEDLRDKLATPSAMVGALTGGAKPIAIMYQSYRGGRYHLWGGRGERKLPPPQYDERFKFLRIPLPADPHRQAVVLARELWKQGKTPDDLSLERDENHEFENVTERMESELNLGPSDFRVFTKVALELLAHERPALARLTCLRSARHFARHGGDLNKVSFKPDSFSDGAGLVNDPSALAPLAHLVEVWSFGRCLFARIGLFRYLVVTAPLTQAWDGPPVALHYSFDPLDPKKIIRLAANNDGPNLSITTETRMAASIDRFVHALEEESKKINSRLPPAKQAPAPNLDELRPRVQREFDKLVAREGQKTARPKKRA